MVIFNKLFGRRGDVRALLGITESGVADLSDAEEWSQSAVLSNLTFFQIAVNRVEINLDFTGSTFSKCTFDSIRSTAHLWGANDIWEGCCFKGAKLEAMIAPMNSFCNCAFEKAELVNFKPYQTLFEDCTFSSCNFAGIRAQQILNRTMVNPQLNPSDIGTSVVFRRCKFERMVFRESYFAGIEFNECEYKSITTEHCDFTDVRSDTKWWNAQNGDPFTIFITKVLEFIGATCGNGSRAYEVFENYVLDYGTGRTKHSVISNCRYC